MTKTSLALMLLLFSGCYHKPTSCEIYIAPSAESKTEQIVEAAQWWNRTEGKTICTVSATDSEVARDGVVVIRQVSRPLLREGTLASTRWQEPGNLIWVTLGQATTVQALAHELGHCMGLDHEGDLKNLMYPISGDRWDLTPEQKAEVWQ